MSALKVPKGLRFKGTLKRPEGREDEDSVSKPKKKTTTPEKSAKVSTEVEKLREKLRKGGVSFQGGKGVATISSKETYSYLDEDLTHLVPTGPSLVESLVRKIELEWPNSIVLFKDIESLHQKIEEILAGTEFQFHPEMWFSISWEMRQFDRFPMHPVNGVYPYPANLSLTQKNAWYAKRMFLNNWKRTLVTKQVVSDWVAAQNEKKAANELKFRLEGIGVRGRKIETKIHANKTLKFDKSMLSKIGKK